MRHACGAAAQHLLAQHVGGEVEAGQGEVDRGVQLVAARAAVREALQVHHLARTKGCEYRSHLGFHLGFSASFQAELWGQRS